METREVLLKRRSIRKYQDRSISEEDLQEIIEAGLFAPSAVDLQPWYFVVIKNKETMEQLKQIMGEVSDKIHPILEDRFTRHPNVVRETTEFIRRLGNAPVCILVFQFKEEYQKTESSIDQSIGAAIENILLAAADKGIGTCWLTAPVEVEMGELFRDKYAPGKGSLKAIISMGYSDQEPRTPKRKQGRYMIL